MGLEIDYAEGSFLYTSDGKSYIDFISGIAVSSLGHRHPAVVKAIKEQVDRHLHVMVYGEYIQNVQARLADRLTGLLPARMDRVYFVNSGTEANEGALKLAKKYTGQSHLVSFEHSYHGDTHGSLSVTGRDVYRDPYKPLLPDVTFLEFNDLDKLDRITVQTAAVIVEPIQGEGGVIPADPHWLGRLRARCDETDTLLIFDEVQTGMYRTGPPFAFQDYEVVPDIMTLAKAFGGGMPLGGIVSSSGIFEVFQKDPPLNHVTTFGGHPVSCAAADAALEELSQKNYGKRAREIEKAVRELESMEKITEIRGKGAMLGMELSDREMTRTVVDRCLEQGVILGWTLHSETLIRLAPPLTISDDTLGKALRIIAESIREV